MRTGVLSRTHAQSHLAAPLLAALLLLLSGPASAVAPEVSPPPSAEIPAPSNFSAKDRPGDGGNAILLTWKDPPGLPANALIQIRRAVPPSYEWSDVAAVKLGVERYEDTAVKDGTVYRYELAVADTSRAAAADRSEERRVGKECSVTCRSRWSPYH